MSFEKFTDKARKVLVLAQDEARSLHQPYVGTEHILLGLIQEKDGLAAQALDRLNVKYDAVVQVIRQVVAIDEDTDVSGHLSFTPRVKRVLENSLREAMQMGNRTSPPSICCWASSARATAPRSKCSRVSACRATTCAAR